MIKGVNKTIIEVNDTGSKYFDKAILYINPTFANSKKDVNSKAKEYLAGVGELKSNYFSLCEKTIKRQRFRARLIVSISAVVMLAGMVVFAIMK